MRGQSYCRDWTVAQVLSHLGSGAEIALLTLQAALRGNEQIDREAIQPIWDAWNARSPDAQAADALMADSSHVQALEQASDDELAMIRLPLMGMELDAAGLIRLRLGEHAVHTWDVAVTQDPAVLVAADAVALLIDSVPEVLAPRIGNPQDPPLRARVITTAPERDYLLTAADQVTMSDWPGNGQYPGVSADEVRMPAEALLRLAYGRLDDGHLPDGLAASPDVLAGLRRVFPGL